MSQNPKFDKLSIREQAAIIWAIVTDCDDWPKIYVLAKIPNPEDKTTFPKHIATVASRWKHSFNVQTFYETQKLALQAKYNLANGGDEKSNKNVTSGDLDGEKGILDAGGAETEKPEGRKTKDFTETKQALNELNRLANLIPDAKAKADAITTIQKLVIQTKTESGEKDLQRFYTPLKCSECAIYLLVKGKKG